MNRLFLFGLLLAIGCNQVEPVGVDIKGTAKPANSANGANGGNASHDVELRSGTHMVDEVEIPKLLERVNPSSIGEIVIPDGSFETPAVVFGQKIQSRIEGRVVEIVDANQIIVLIDNKQIKVRLAGVDAPKLAEQPFGRAAKAALTNLITGRSVSVLVTGEHKTGSTLGFVMMPLDDFCAEMNISDWLIAMGWAWHNDSNSESKELAELENKAREANKGLWAGRSNLDRIPPWRWRAGLRSWEILQAGNVGQ